jgi:hypothetical protein
MAHVPNFFLPFLFIRISNFEESIYRFVFVDVYFVTFGAHGSIWHHVLCFEIHIDIGSL